MTTEQLYREALERIVESVPLGKPEHLYEEGVRDGLNLAARIAERALSAVTSEEIDHD